MKTPTTIEELDEVRARALANYHLDGNVWDEKNENDAPHTKMDYARNHHLCRDYWRGIARTIREADDNAGLVTVPKVPTGKMLEAAESADDYAKNVDENICATASAEEHYAAMIAEWGAANKP
jgi:hypothetical protein